MVTSVIIRILCCGVKCFPIIIVNLQVSAIIVIILSAVSITKIEDELDKKINCTEAEHKDDWGKHEYTGACLM